MKRLLITLIFTFTLLLSACGKEETTLTDDFKEFHFNSESGVFKTSRGTEMVVFNLEKETGARI